jgi:16S rRNA (adenine1518-N6/adenine1519-N6)-dimethyltransferase
MDAVPPGLRPKKSLGQNFLVNPGAVRRIQEAALACPAEGLLEIGPGEGALTEGLSRDGRPLLAVDLDPEAIELLQSRFGHLPHVSFLLGDAVSVPLPLDRTLSVVGNLPYNAATAILARLLVEDLPWRRMVLMFQLEVGQKILGLPGTKAYGPLSILAQACSRPSRLLKLGPGSFDPPPQVDSAVLLFEPRPEDLPAAERRGFLAFLHRSFAHRRKTRVNNWQGWLEGPQARARLEGAGLGPAIRPEAVTVAQWRALWQALQERGC